MMIFETNLEIVQVAGRFEIDAEAVLLGLVAARGSSVSCEQPAFPVGVFAFAGRLRFRGWTREGIRRIIRFMVGPGFRVRIAVGPSRAVVALSVHATFCNHLVNVSRHPLVSPLLSVLVGFVKLLVDVSQSHMARRWWYPAWHKSPIQGHPLVKLFFCFFNVVKNLIFVVLYIYIIQQLK